MKMTTHLIYERMARQIISLASTQNLKLTVYGAKGSTHSKGRTGDIFMYSASHDAMPAEFWIMQSDLLFH